MNKNIKVLGIAIVAAVAAFIVLLLSGLGTTSLADINGDIQTFTTVNLGVNEFGILMIVGVLVSVLISGLALNTIDKN